MKFTYNGITLTYSLGNKKLPKDTLIFNLPEGHSCPEKTPMCAAVCYASKATRVYQNVALARSNNWAEMASLVGLKSDKVSALSAMVRHEYDKGRIKRVRIHEAGDFFSLEYLDIWMRVAEENPDVLFYAYTHSIQMLSVYFMDSQAGFREAPPSNFILHASTDASTPPRVFRYALNLRKKGIIKHIFHMEGNKVVPKENTVCMQDCTKCNLCFNPKAGQVYVTVKVH